ncbi:hypothetical protein B1H58_15370 [Pantoea alhagi]|uniref:DUF2591 domain-containing protein n=1 Tax=Pantoea alhagi TaxID=1891675 RepID=A0A1W6B851_9GAMM|nr:phage protein NinX family protein [Pantoea alhagi]ARJ43276.1 hypothetical protein B1H58_15370 [Pantoea alhagi]
MDYSKKSDFEINWRVFVALHDGAPDFKEGENGAMVVTFTANDVQLGEHVEFEVEAESFNPCNSWADAGPIIRKNSISLISDWNEEGLWGATFRPWIYSEHENPLRAAMECYLMMHDKEEE